MTRLVVLLILSGCCLRMQGQDTLIIRRADHNFRLDTIWTQLPEPAGLHWTLEEARAQQGYQKAGSSPVRKGFDFKQPAGQIWFRLPLRNRSADTLHECLTLYSPDNVWFYLISDTAILHKTGGVKQRVSEREVKDGSGAVFTFRVAPGQAVELYLRAAELSGTRPEVSAQLQDRHTRRITELTQINNVMPGVIFIGMLLIMMLYNLIIFFSVRDRAYLYYCLYLFCLGGGLYFDSMVGPMPQFGFDNPVYNSLTGTLGFWASFICYLLFGRHFIGLRDLNPRWDRILNRLIRFKWGVLTVSLGYGAAVGDFGQASVIMLIDTILLMLILPLLFVAIWRSGSTVGRYYISGSILVFFVAFLTVILNLFTRVFNPFVIFTLAILGEILIFSLGLGYKMRKTQQEKLEAQLALNAELSKVNTAFGRFVPHEFLRSLGKASAVEAQLGDQVERVVTVLFSDIRDYTSLSEQMTPKDNFDFLNAYLGRIGPIIQAHGGFVNQYYGDGIMALFMEQPADALRAATGMQQAIETYNAYRVSKGRTPLRIGIGLHTGSLMMGMIGDLLRMDTGVVSDTVNTASRMEGLTKYYGAGIILSESVYAGLPEALRQDIRRLGQVLVKGRKTPLQVYECFGGDPEPERSRKRASLDAFHGALDAYLSADFAAAMQQWDALAGAPDGAAAHFAAQTLQYLRDGAPPGWTGIEAMAHK